MSLVELEENPLPPLLKNLSYSGLSELHLCPRKFVLNKLRVRKDTRSVTFSFGHAVGTGIQSTLEGKDESRILFDMFLSWDYPDLYGEEEKSNKSFWSAVIAVQRFKLIRESNILNEYELAFYDGKPCIELGFRITTPDGFKYRGYVDVVLRHKRTGEFLVLELKTTGWDSIEPATYKNSGQALGYSIVLDKISPGKSSYEVLYLVLSSKSMEFTALPFVKNYLERAEWIHALMLDIEIIKLYNQNQLWPKNGASCRNYFRDCEHIQTCGLNLKHQVPVSSWTEEPEPEEFSIDLSLVDLIDSQLERV